LRFHLFLFLTFLFYSPIAYSANFRVVDIDLLINENSYFIKLIDNIENDQIKHKKNFENIEKELQLSLEKINNSRLILNQTEIENQINDYNNNLANLHDQIKKFNYHYENQINNFKDIILQTILELLKNYASENKIDLILDAKSYIIASNSINITENILINLNKIKFDTEFEKYR
jgi:Skp family chaperone for outer membrane proteins